MSRPKLYSKHRPYLTNRIVKKHIVTVKAVKGFENVLTYLSKMFSMNI